MAPWALTRSSKHERPTDITLVVKVTAHLKGQPNTDTTPQPEKRQLHGNERRKHIKHRTCALGSRLHDACCVHFIHSLMCVRFRTCQSHTTLCTSSRTGCIYLGRSFLSIRYGRTCAPRHHCTAQSVQTCSQSSPSCVAEELSSNVALGSHGYVHLLQRLEHDVVDCRHSRSRRLGRRCPFRSRGADEGPLCLRCRCPCRGRGADEGPLCLRCRCPCRHRGADGCCYRSSSSS